MFGSALQHKRNAFIAKEKSLREAVHERDKALLKCTELEDENRKLLITTKSFDPSAREELLKEELDSLQKLWDEVSWMQARRLSV